MIPKLVHFHPVHDYILHLCFADGVEGDVDLKGELYGKLFEPLNKSMLGSLFPLAPVPSNFQEILEAFAGKANVSENRQLIFRIHRQLRGLFSRS